MILVLAWIQTLIPINLSLYAFKRRSIVVVIFFFHPHVSFFGQVMNVIISFREAPLYNISRNRLIQIIQIIFQIIRMNT